ncbi:MAG TPA: Gfo/Idh/MocA family oxidoreductase [Candidatus Krumholzibacteria bacterium]|nr:Gfo/Idh/MocA family oxidoreductase [Candidatus Krumholzibacteria bacterium]
MKLRGALLGAGNIAMRGHAPQWLGDERLRDEVEIVAVSDLSSANLSLARANFPAARAYASAEELLERENVDFCDICTPPSTHRFMIESGAARGLHLLCEKPLAHTLEEAEAIAHTIRAAGVVFQPCHQYHYSPQWAAVRALLPRIGAIHLAEYDVLRTAANEGNPHWQPKWRTDPRLAGGGILMDHGAHIFYQLLSVLGKPASVQATVRTLRHHEYGVEDTACVVLDFGTALATIRLTWAARQREVRFRFVGERGEIIGDDGRVAVVTERGVEEVPGASMSKDSTHSEWYAPLFRRFAERVRAKETEGESLEEALMVTRLIARAYQSSAESRTLFT